MHLSVQFIIQLTVSVPTSIINSPGCSIVLGVSVKVCGFTCADFLVGGVRCVPSCIAHLGGIHAVLSPELPLCSPETAHTFKKRYQSYGKPSTLQHREGLATLCITVVKYLLTIRAYSIDHVNHLYTFLVIHNCKFNNFRFH